MSFNLTVTHHGLAAALQPGVCLHVTHVALGDGAAYAPNGGESGLVSERQRVAVAGGGNDGSILHISAIADGPAAYPVSEVGLLLADGTLLALWSGDALAWKNAGSELVLDFDLALESLPPGSVIVDSAQTIGLSMAEEYTRLAIAQINGMRRDIVYMRTHSHFAAQRCACDGSGGGTVTPPTVIPSSGGYYTQSFSGTVSVAVPHHLGAYPHVSVIDGQGYEYNVQIRHLDLNNLLLTANEPIIGTVICSTTLPGTNAADYNFSEVLSYSAAHNLGRYPSVTVIDTLGQEFSVSVQHNGLNALTIRSEALMSGVLVLN